MNVVELALAAHHLLDGAGIPHGFGGALALNLYVDPRATVDVDLSAFVSWDQRREVIERFASIGYHPDDGWEESIPVAGIRLHGADRATGLDLFFALDEHYDRVRQRLRPFPFGPGSEPLPFYSAEDVVVFKLSFNRPKDWVDIAKVVDHGPPLDVDYIEELLVAIRGPAMYPRVARLRAMVEAGGELR